jgi:hypothetical protein
MENNSGYANFLCDTEKLGAFQLVKESASKTEERKNVFCVSNYRKQTSNK